MNISRSIPTELEEFYQKVTEELKPSVIDMPALREALCMTEAFVRQEENMYQSRTGRTLLPALVVRSLDGINILIYPQGYEA